MTEINANSNQAKRSRKILDAIRKNPDNFAMRTWYCATDPDFGVLMPQETPQGCGTTLCVAGWAAHFAGHVLHSNRAHTDKSVSVAQVAQGWLEMWDDDNLFFTEEDIAVACLKRMASGEPYSYDMLEEESARSDDSNLAEDVRMQLLLDIAPSHLSD